MDDIEPYLPKADDGFSGAEKYSDLASGSEDTDSVS